MSVLLLTHVQVRPSDWRPLMPVVREVAVALAQRGVVDITQKGQVRVPSAQDSERRRPMGVPLPSRTPAAPLQHHACVAHCCCCAQHCWCAWPQVVDPGSFKGPIRVRLRQQTPAAGEPPG